MESSRQDLSNDMTEQRSTFKNNRNIRTISLFFKTDHVEQHQSKALAETIWNKGLNLGQSWKVIKIRTTPTLFLFVKQELPKTCLSFWLRCINLVWLEISAANRPLNARSFWPPPLLGCLPLPNISYTCSVIRFIANNEVATLCRTNYIFPHSLHTLNQPASLVSRNSDVDLG